MSFHATKDLVPEAILLGGIVACLVLAVARRATSVHVYMLVSGVALIASALSCLIYLKGLPGAGFDAYSGAVVVDRLSIFATPALCGFTLLTVLSGEALGPRVRPHAGEYHALLLAATLGGVLLASARDMVALYIAAELLGVSLSILVAMVKTDTRGGEAAFKQIVLGAAASAVMLYGFAILYGLAGSTSLVDVAAQLRHTSGVAALGITLAIAGMAFKLGAVPFQQWLPVVAEGAPAPIAGLVTSLGATAGFAMLARVVVTGLPQSRSTWTAVVAVLATASMAYGTLGALAQRRVRRLLAYSGIAQAGFVLMGLAAATNGGVGASLFSLLTSGVALIGAFAAVTAAETGGVSDDLDSYRGLSARSPFAAAALAAAMLSLVGLPPLVGFFAKVVVFQAAVLAGWGWMLVIAVTATVVGAAAAFRVVKVMYVDLPEPGAEELEPEPPALRGALVAAAGATVFLGVLAQPLLHVASAAAGNVP